MNCPLLQRSPWYCTLFLTAFLSGEAADRERRSRERSRPSSGAIWNPTKDFFESLYYNLLEILNFDNIVKFKTAVFIHKIFKKKEIPAIFSDFIIPAVDIHSHKTRYTTQENLFWTNIRTDYGKFMFRYKAVHDQVWESVPSHVKSLTEPAFRKQCKTFLLSNQW